MRIRLHFTEQGSAFFCGKLQGQVQSLFANNNAKLGYRYTQKGKYQILNRH